MSKCLRFNSTPLFVAHWGNWSSTVETEHQEHFECFDNVTYLLDDGEIMSAGFSLCE